MRRALLLTFFGLSISCSRGASDRGAPAPASASSAAADDGLPSAANTQPIVDDAPVVVVERDQVLVDGAAVGSLDAIREAARPQRVDGEFTALKSKREAWKTSHPGATFAGAALLRMPRDTKALVVKSVFQTAAFAGYPNLAFAVGTGSPRRTERILVDAQIPLPPGAGTGPSAADEKVLYVHLAPESSVMLTWKQGATVVAETEVPWRDAFERTGEDVRPAGLAAKVSAEWSAQRQHADPQDRKLDQAIVQADDATELRFIVAALDALYAPKRSLAGANVPAFNVTLSLLNLAAASPGEPARGPNGTPRMVMGATSVSGRLPPEVIQRIVRQSFKRFRGCYEAGLAKDPALRGKVSVRFVIGKDGAVTSVADAGSDLPAADVRKCIFSTFSRLTFPAPEGGIVTVVYPLDLSPQ